MYVCVSIPPLKYQDVRAAVLEMHVKSRWPVWPGSNAGVGRQGPSSVGSGQPPELEAVYTNAPGAAGPGDVAAVERCVEQLGLVLLSSLASTKKGAFSEP